MKMTRRSLLAAGMTLPALKFSVLLDGGAERPGRRGRFFFDPWVEVHRANLRHNVLRLRDVSRPGRSSPSSRTTATAWAWSMPAS